MLDVQGRNEEAKSHFYWNKFSWMGKENKVDNRCHSWSQEDRVCPLLLECPIFLPIIQLKDNE